MFRLKFIFFLLIAHQLQSQELYFSSFQPFQNLPSLETYNTFQDSKGFIWVCTDAGLHRYNGKTLTTYTTEEGIPENVVLRAYEDKKGRIWFSTLSGYFFYYQDNEFHSITANKFLKKYFRSQSPDAFFIGENDTLFCGPKSIQGILKIAPQNNYTKIIMFRNCIPSANRILINNKLNPGETIMGSGGTYAT
ncbi:MAG TPA: two-component regulator propeller domain-containing protein, partial [Bacteroidia bacterium]|nr:two-component regulator propeller domain-containing protein [Bacteroidia bacterium]